MKAALAYLTALSLAFGAAACKRSIVKEAAPETNAREAALVKAPNVARMFYPGDRRELTKAVKGRLAEAEASLPAASVVAIVTPHAGYEFSGGVAATAFRQLEGRRPATVVLLGPSHHCARPAIATASYDGYETPLGVAEVDRELVAEVARRCPDVSYSDVPYAAEHCLEVQLPFVQTLFPGARVAPFIFCRHDGEAAERFGKALAEAIAARASDTIIVTTCDLSHYHPYDEAVKLDRAFVETFRRFDVGELYAALDEGTFEIDAVGAVAATFWCGKAMGATRAVALEYKNSGDVTGDVSRGVVGYVAAAVVR
ncbi:MAG: AmmeMemoRadiSam system protein B [candidate division Zixibacteria bacterium]|nr:AmmeMemoRadiSam system protein B [candidate division Zixibacteria bacterium]